MHNVMSLFEQGALETNKKVHVFQQKRITAKMKEVDFVSESVVYVVLLQLATDGFVIYNENC